MSLFLRRYQGIVIADYSRGKDVKNSGDKKANDSRGEKDTFREYIISGPNARALASKSGARVREAMIQNAGATAMKGVVLRVTANPSSLPMCTSLGKTVA